MPISEQEQRDLDTARTAVTEIQVSTFDFMRILLHMTSTELGHSGHKSLGAALEYAMREAEARINKVWKAHLKKYPD